MSKNNNKKQLQVQEKTKENQWKLALKIGIMALLTFLLVWNYRTNSLDDTNLAFTDFQLESEVLVSAAIQADQAGVDVGAVKYGLGYYSQAEPEKFTPYESQYGLQGKVFKYVARMIHQENPVPALQWICSLLTALVFMAIVVLLRRKYNMLFAGCFYVTFWLSPWVVNFARNLYWVEFTWFLPMLVGLYCSIKIDNKKHRIFSYCAAFITIGIKSLCGYEYITTIMMGLLLFLGMDMVVAFVEKDKEKTILILRTAVIMGLAALAGFLCAIFIHAVIRGDGSMLEGFRSIWDKDVMRRTLGGKVENFDPVYKDSLSASIGQVVKMYFQFTSSILAGIPGKLFPFLCLAPLPIFFWNIKSKKMEYADVAGYVISLLTTISWFALAKAHSYIHTHMNFVLWYFGYVQICIYIVLKQFCNGVQLCRIETTRAKINPTRVNQSKKNKNKSGKSNGK